MWKVVTLSLRQAIVPDHILGGLNSSDRLLAWARCRPAQPSPGPARR
jgi:hypothetical protein